MQLWDLLSVSIVANLFIKEHEIKIINTTTHQPRLWLRYVDNTFVIQKVEHNHQFLQHIYSIDLHIQFTAESPNTCQSIPFWTPWSHQDQTIHFLLLFIENLPTQTINFIWIAIITYLLSIVCLILSYTGLELFVQNLQLLHKEKEHIKEAIQRF